MRPVEAVPVDCLNCGKTLSRKPYTLIHRNVFCSSSCSARYSVGKSHSDSANKKRSLKLSGPLAPRWQGGISRGFKRGYFSEQYKHWRKSVFEKDNYTCQDCGQHGGYLTAHHMKPFAKFPELRYEVSNGMTLCGPCHAKRDNYYAKLHPEVRGVELRLG